MIGSKESFYCFVFCTRWLSCKEKWHPETLSVEQRMLQIDGMSGVHDPSQGKSCWVNEQKVEKGQIALASTGSQPIPNSSILNSQKPWGETRVKQAQPTTHRNHVSQSEGTLWSLSCLRACWMSREKVGICPWMILHIYDCVFFSFDSKAKILKP